jgi:predicted membrane metal-binding protein
VSGIGVAIGIGMVKDFTKFPTLDPIVTVWLISTATCDVCITAILSVYLVGILQTLWQLAPPNYSLDHSIVVAPGFVKPMMSSIAF